LDKQALGIEINDFSEPLGQINIVKQQLNCKESLKEIQVEISQLKEIDANLIDRWLVQPNLKLQVIRFVDKGFEDQFPKVQRKFYCLKLRIFRHLLEILFIFWRNVLNV
jgi:hypothetical protein